MKKLKGRPSGSLILTQSFEALLAPQRILKKDVAADAGVSPSFLGDLLAHRCGASEEVANRIASTLGVPIAAIFPGYAGWVGPLVDRSGNRLEEDAA